PSQPGGRACFGQVVGGRVRRQQGDRGAGPCRAARLRVTLIDVVRPRIAVGGQHGVEGVVAPGQENAYERLVIALRGLGGGVAQHGQAHAQGGGCAQRSQGGGVAQEGAAACLL